jgi:hypothetical protein
MAITAFMAGILLATTPVRADIWNFNLDSSQSSVLVTFTALAPTGQQLVETDVSSLAGTMSVDLGSVSNPFGTAQIQAWDSVLAEGLNYTFNFTGLPQITAVSSPNTIQIDLSSFGAAGNVAGGSFDQLGNVLRNQGTFVINGAGFNNTPIDFDTNNDQDFLGYQVSRTGDVVTLIGDFDFNYDFEEGVFSGNLRWQGNFVAFASVPEPSALVILGGMALMVAAHRRRR